MNRELCIALAELGHEVCCVVLDSQAHEVANAQANGVTLANCPSRIQIVGSERYLLLSDKHFGDFKPEIVIGHDHKTGPYAAKLAEDFSAAYVHFVHTVPDVAEFHKSRQSTAEPDLFVGSRKQGDQTQLAREAKLIVAVGPRIHDAVVTNLGHGAPAHMMMPGLNRILLRRRQEKPLPQLRCLLVGRMEDALLKGADLGCKAVKKVAIEQRADGRDRKLTLRGFDPKKAQTEFDQIGPFSDYQSYVRLEPYTPLEADIHEDMRTASVVLMPSRVEGFGLTGFEAIAAGVPVVVALDSGLGRYLIESARKGLIDVTTVERCVAATAPDGDALVDEWAAKIHGLLADRDDALVRAEVLRRTLEDVLNWQTAARALSQAIEDVL